MKGQLWLGTQQSHWEHLTTELNISKLTPSEKLHMSLEHRKLMLRYDDDWGEDNPHREFGRQSHMMSRQGTLAVIHISGELTSTDSWINEFFGRVSYADIRRCVVKAVDTEDITGIVLDMDTPGGSACGIMELSDFLKEIDASTKPIYTYTGTAMCSGGYWLGCVGRKIYASPMATVGSIGVIMAHQSYARMVADMGIDATVFRSGEFKALGHPLEPLDEKATKHLQASLDKTYDTFLEHVAENRGMSVKTLRNTAAEGLVFPGSEAIDVGLVDELAYFDKALAEISQEISDQSESTTTNGTNPMNKKVITKKAQAALASGVAEAQVLADADLTSESASEATEATEETAGTSASVRTASAGASSCPGRRNCLCRVHSPANRTGQGKRQARSQGRRT